MTPTSEIMRKMEYEKNPVTRSTYRQIIGNRIDNALEAKGNNRQKDRHKPA